MIKKILFLVVLLTLATLFLQNCDTTEPKIEKNILLQEMDVSVTEAYLHISFESAKTRELTLFRNGERIADFICTQKDTVITDTALTQNTNYQYKINEYENNSVISESNNLSLSTLEPTTHDFQWEEYTFGDYQSFLYDAAIIEDSTEKKEIWAVGEIYLKDKNGNYDAEPYGLVKYIKDKWNITRIPSASYNHQYIVNGPGLAILIQHNIYITSGASLLYWDGNSFIEKAFFLKTLPFSGQVSCMWGKTENDIYLGSGNDGSLYHYYGNGWEEIDLGSINGGITDIYGYKSANNNKYKVFVTVTFVGKPSDHKLLTINEDNSITEFPWMEEERISSVWTRKGFPIYSAGNGVHIWKGEKWDKIKNLPNKFAGHVSGTKLNNIFVVGDFNMILHYNGETWKVVEDNGNGWYQTVKVTEEMAVMAGTKDGKGIVKIGRKN